jgi:hypothetical protein
MINEQHRAPMTLARLKAVAASPNGFETVTPQGARQLLEEIAGQPEAPKGQEAATAGCADKQFGEPEPICEAHRQAISAVDALRSRLAAAKAKLAEVTLAKDTFFDALQKTNARADAAEDLAAATATLERVRALASRRKASNLSDNELLAALADEQPKGSKQMSIEDKQIANVLAHGFELIRHGQCDAERRLGHAIHAIAVMAELYLRIPVAVRREHADV